MEDEGREAGRLTVSSSHSPTAMQVPAPPVPILPCLGRDITKTLEILFRSSRKKTKKEHVGWQGACTSASSSLMQQALYNTGLAELAFQDCIKPSTESKQMRKSQRTLVHSQQSALLIRWTSFCTDYNLYQRSSFRPPATASYYLPR